MNTAPTPVTTPSHIPGWTSRHRDGRPGIEYFTGGIAFAWTGSLADPVEISPGGYGEPVEHLLDLSNLLAMPRQPLDNAFDDFARLCDEWLTWADENQAGRLPIRAELDTETSTSRQHHIEAGAYLVRAARP